MWQLVIDRASVTNSDAQCDAPELHRERTSIRVVDGAGYANDDHSADSFGSRLRRHADTNF